MLQDFLSGAGFWLVLGVVIVAMQWCVSGHQTAHRAGLLSEKGPGRDARKRPRPDAG